MDVEWINLVQLRTVVKKVMEPSGCLRPEISVKVDCRMRLEVLKTVIIIFSLLLLCTAIGCSPGGSRPNTGQNKVHTMQTYIYSN
jgi:hypothetical protein